MSYEDEWDAELDSCDNCGRCINKTYCVLEEEDYRFRGIIIP